MSKRYTVAGGGLAGLSAAIELASAGAKVTLYEQSKTLGGRAATHHQQGYAMNIGPHGFYRMGFMRKQFDAWGIRYSGKPPVQKSDSYLLADGRKLPFPSSVARLFTSGAFGLAEKFQIAAAFAKIGNRAPEGMTMRAWIDTAVSSQRARQMLEALTRLSCYAADLDKLDAGAALRQLQIAIKASVLYIDGGWETLIAGLASKAESLGVRILRETPLPALDAEGVVLAIPPRQVEQLTGTQVLKGLVPVKAACLDLGLRKLPAGAAIFALGLDRAYYVSVHSAAASGLAPKGSAMVHIAKYLNTGETADRPELEAVADLALPGWRAEAEVQRFLPDMAVVHCMPTVVGRPGVDALGIPNVMIAGDWVGPDSMLADAAVASGVRAAKRLVGHGV